MAGALFLVGETKVRPNVYVRVTNIGEPADATVTLGTVMAVFEASWGPYGATTIIDTDSVDLIDLTYGDAAASPKADAAREALRGGALQVLCYRLGSGGTKATLTLKDTATPSPADVVKIDAKYEGTLGNSLKITVRDNLTDPSLRDVLIYKDTTLLEEYTYDPGADEPEALVAALANSQWVTANKISAGNNTVDDVTQSALTTGADPVITGADYSTALTNVEGHDWDVLTVDTNDTSVHATVATYIDRVRKEGKRVMAVIGEPGNVAWSTRLANAQSYNHYALVYVANGFKNTEGQVVDGYKAAARVAGMIAGSSITNSLTHAVIRRAVDLPERLSNQQIIDAINSGAFVFTFNANRQVIAEYGITTFTQVDADHDAGWKKIRRTRTRDNLIDRIANAWEPMIGQVSNNERGRASLMAQAQQVIRQMISEGALTAGSIRLDPGHPPAGDSAWFLIEADDVDSLEKMYLTFGFRFAPPAA